ncbi:MAG: VanZ family protein [Chromatiales bacterium]|jgi:VanZ family protein
MPLPLTLALLASIAVLTVSVLPGDSRAVRAVPERVQKAMHVAAYAVVAALWSWTLGLSEMEPPGRTALAVGLATGLGALIEYLQRYRPGRYGTWADVARNAVGAVIGAVAAWWI